MASIVHTPKQLPRAVVDNAVMLLAEHLTVRKCQHIWAVTVAIATRFGPFMPCRVGMDVAADPPSMSRRTITKAHT